LKIISWNVNGLRANYKKGFINFLKKEKPDVLCLQEIKADIEQIPEEILSLKDYKILINPAFKKGYSGTMIFSKKESLGYSFKSGFKEFDLEGRFIRIDFKEFILINLYMPHGPRDKSKLPYKIKAYKKLFSYFKKIKNKKIILTGDFNIAHQEIDLARPNQNKNNIMFTKEERLMIDKLLSLGFVDSYRFFNPNLQEFSWWPYFANARERNIGWRIDYFFISKKIVNKIKKSFILNKTTGSDHCPVGIKKEI